MGTPLNSAVTPDVTLDLACPHCGHLQQVAHDFDDNERDVATCPQCGEMFSLPEPEKPQQADDDRGTQLSRQRIRVLAARRRAVIRTRTYWIVTTVGLAAAALLLLQKAWVGYRAAGELQPRQLGFIAFVLVFAILTPMAFRRVRELGKEIATSDLPDVPAGNIDWTPMGDGSQRFKDLEDIR